MNLIVSVFVFRVVSVMVMMKSNSKNFNFLSCPRVVRWGTV